MVRSMLHFHTLSDRAGAVAYFRSMDYHFEGAELRAYTMGKGAELLGLPHEASIDHFRALIDNHDPFTGEVLTAAKRSDRDFARDMTVSLPKSVSIAASVGGDGRIDAAVDRALERMFAVMERDSATRVRKGGKDENRNTGNLVAFVFAHDTSRPIGGEPDPQKHRHVVIMNLTWDQEEGQWKAVQFQPLLKDSGYYNAIFRSELARELNDLGYPVEKTKDAFEITGIPSSAIRKFSRRTALIEHLADTLGIKSPEAKAKLGSTSREYKSKGRSWEDLVDGWRRRLSPAELEAVDAVRGEAVGPLTSVDRSREALAWAVDHCFERQSVVEQRTLVREALRHGLGDVTVEGIYEELGKRKDLIRRKLNGRDVVSTQGIRKEEDAILKFAVDGRGRYAPLGVKGAVVPETLELGKNKPPSKSQAEAIRHLWTSPDRVIVWGGKAGVGKTDALKAALAKVRVRWRAFATQSGASRGVLRESGFDNADTLAALFKSREMQESVRGGLIVVDEIGQTGTEEFRKLTNLATELDARILVVGDHRQHKSVARGDVIRLLTEKAGLPVAEVNEIKRQSGEYRQVAELLSAGEVGTAFEKLNGMGWVKESGVEDDYLAALKAGKTALIVAPTHAEGDRLTESIRERLKAEGKVKDEREIRRLRPLNMTKPEVQEAKKRPEPGMVFIRDAAYREETQAIGVGDILRSTAPIKDTEGRRIDTGSVMEVTGWTEKGIRVKTGSGLSRVLAADVGHVRAGYVTTSQSGQGKTVDRMFLWAPAATFPAVRMDTAYTSGTRGREQLTVYTDDKEGLLQAAKREDHRLLASDLVRQPRNGLRQRLKKHLSFLRRVASLGRDREHTIQPQLEIVHER